VVVAGVLIESAHGTAAQVAGRLVRVQGVSLQGGDGASRIAAVLEAADGAALEELTERLLREDEQILGVFPVFVGSDDGAP
jgi:hypothetical protein